jgi:hypothetical protein
MHTSYVWLKKTYAARLFQAAWRQSVERDRFLVAKDGIILMQAVARGRAARNDVKQLHLAAARIQATYKMHGVRDTVGSHRLATTVLLASALLQRC